MPHYQDMAEAYTIFAKYAAEGKFESSSAEHDEIYAGPDPEEISEEDRERLEQLGWYENEEYQCFIKYT